MSLWLAAALVFSASEPVAVTGTVRVVRGTTAPEVMLVLGDDETLTLVGELAAEVRRIQGARVEVVGLRDGQTFVVRHYAIVDLGGGTRPTLVGKLVAVGEHGLGIQDGEAPPISLSLAPKLQRKLAVSQGAKVWVIGKKLLSGEIKVTRFGVLSEPQPASDKDAPAGSQGEP